MRPENLTTRIFLDGGDPQETKEIIDLLGFLDGQTTNPTLIAKNLGAKRRSASGGPMTEAEVLAFYRGVVEKISEMIPKGSVSVEVYADHTTKAKTMLTQGKEMFSWVPNAHVKFPTTTQGLEAAERATADGVRVNMTLCFTQEQAAAVYAATRGVKRGDVFVSPFVGRIDDRGENGMDLIANVLRMYKEGDGHVEVLTASARHLDHFLFALHLGSDIITAPANVLREWAADGAPIAVADFTYDAGGLTAIPYQDTNLNKPWRDYDIRHELTDKGIERFANDWNQLIRHGS